MYPAAQSRYVCGLPSRYRRSPAEPFGSFSPAGKPHRATPPTPVECRRQTQNVVSSITKAGSVRHACNSAGTPSNTPATTVGGSSRTVTSVLVVDALQPASGGIEQPEIVVALPVPHRAHLLAGRPVTVEGEIAVSKWRGQITSSIASNCTEPPGRTSMSGSEDRSRVEITGGSSPPNNDFAEPRRWRPRRRLRLQRNVRPRCAVPRSLSVSGYCRPYNAVTFRGLESWHSPRAS